MHIEEGLLADMLEHRDDDTPRLICADWYEDHGQPERAELIRIQCQLAHLAADAPDRRRLQTREKELLAAHATIWAEPLDGFGVTRWKFERGFIESVEITLGSTFRWGLAEMCRFTPLRDVRLVDPNLDLDDLEGGLPDLARLEGLEVGFPQLEATQRTQMRRLIRSPRLKHLRRLGLHSFRGQDQPFGESVFEDLLASPALPALEELNVGSFNSDVAWAVRSLADRLAELRLRVLVLRATVNFNDLAYLLERLPVSRFRGLGLIDFVLVDYRTAGVTFRLIPWKEWCRSLDWFFVRSRWYFPNSAAVLADLAHLAGPLLERAPYHDDPGETQAAGYPWDRYWSW